ncbi:MAG: deoxyribose-phosphate aldolase [Thermocrispum sp.]
MPQAPSALVDVTRDEAGLRRFLDGLPGVDQVGVEQRAAGLATRSIKKASKLWAIDAAIGMVDLTTLEGADTVGTVRSLCAKARTPDPDARDRHRAASAGAPSAFAAPPASGAKTRPDTPRVAAVCVYPDLVATAVEALTGTGIGVASVATAFPSGRSNRAVKLADTALAVESGATEVDMVIDRGAFLTGRYGAVFEEIQAIKAACGDAHLKVILETGELVTYDNVRKASWLALLAGGDFIKTSTGKVSPAATLPVTHIMLQAVRDWYDVTGELRGVKPAGGIRTSKDAIRYLVAVNEVAGEQWLTPKLFRFGASSLLNDLLLQRRTQLDGHYSGPDYVTVN